MKLVTITKSNRTLGIVKRGSEALDFFFIFLPNLGVFSVNIKYVLSIQFSVRLLLYFSPSYLNVKELLGSVSVPSEHISWQSFVLYSIYLLLTKCSICNYQFIKYEIAVCSRVHYSPYAYQDLAILKFNSREYVWSQIVTLSLLSNYVGIG